jgi:glutaryl-CoA dehydrogenase (non-decarboxylating)
MVVTKSSIDLRNLVRRLGRDSLSDALDENFLAGRTNPAALPAIANAGLLGLTLPPAYGGGGRDYADLAAVCEELGRIDLAFQISVTVHLALTAMTIFQWGTERQQAAWLPPLAMGERIATFGLTEPGAGSDVAALRMSARKEHSGYRLNGEKTWISGANEASLFLLFATVDPAVRHRGITAFIVPRESPGLSTTELTGKLGVRAGDTGSVVCDDVRVPAENVLGEPGEGFAVALSALGNGLFTVGAGALGVAVACLESTVAFIHELDQRGIGAGRKQTVQATIAEMVSGEARARLLIERAAWLKNVGKPSAQATSLAKWTAAKVAYDAAESALAVHQAYSPPPHHTIERHLQNIKGSVIYGGTAEIHQTMQADYALGHRLERPFRRPSPRAEELLGKSLG